MLHCQDSVATESLQLITLMLQSQCPGLCPGQTPHLWFCEDVIQYSSITVLYSTLSKTDNIDVTTFLDAVYRMCFDSIKATVYTVQYTVYCTVDVIATVLQCEHVIALRSWVHCVFSCVLGSPLN